MIKQLFSHKGKGLLVLVTLGVLSVSGCTDSNDEPLPDAASDRVQPVVTQAVEYGVEGVSVEAVGTSRALKSIMIEPAVTGQVTEVNFTANQKVQEGRVLIRLDDRDERLAVELAEVELADAQRALDRFRRSIASGGVTQSDLDAAQSEVDRARIALQRAQVTLDYHTIRAPFTGHIGVTDVDPGAWVSPDTVIASLDDRSTLRVRFQLPEMLLGELSPGESVQFSTWNNQLAIAEGEIVDVSSRVDETSRTFTLRAHVDNEDDSLRPGMSFRSQMTIEGNRYPRVPEISLQWGGEGAYVWTVNEGKAERVMVNVVQRKEDGVLVDGDLTERMPIVTEGVHLVRAGDAVQPVNADPDRSDAPQEGADEASVTGGES